LADNEFRQLLTLLTSVNEIYTAHIAKEEGELFPIARGLLDPSELEVMGKEMAARRGLLIQISRA
jgi:hypothetical protein